MGSLWKPLTASTKTKVNSSYHRFQVFFSMCGSGIDCASSTAKTSKTGASNESKNRNLNNGISSTGIDKARVETLLIFLSTMSYVKDISTMDTHT